MLLFDDVYAAATRGKGAVLLISGPVGAGKTALAQEMTAHARRLGGLCFMVTASAGERGRPFGVLDRLVESMRAAGMPGPFPDAAWFGGCDEHRAMDEIGAAIHRFIGGRPVVIGIDDVHFADEQSLRFLGYVVRRIEHSELVIVLNECTSYERDTAGLRAEMLHLPYCHRIQLAPLTPAEVAEQVIERLGGAADAESIRFCIEVSGGNPLLVHALLDDRTALPGPASGEPGVNFRQAVLRILHRSSPATAEVARLMAVLGEYATPALVAELGGADVVLVRECMRDLYEIGLAGAESADGAEGFRHGHTRSAVLASIPLGSLATLHGRAAELLHASGAPASAVAEHLVTAQDGGKGTWRVDILGEAAREAMTAGDVDSAVNSLRYAVGASSGQEQRAQAAVLAADAQWHADPSRAARWLHGLARDARGGLLTPSGVLIVVGHLLWWGEFGEADELMRLAGMPDEGSSLAQLWQLYRRAGLGVERSAETGPPVEPSLAGSGPMAAVTYLTSAATSAYDDLATEQADQMLDGIRAGTSLTPALYALVMLVRTGRPDEVATWCNALLKEDWVARVPMRRALIGMIKAVAALRAGDGGTALGEIREVLDLVPPPAWGIVAGLPLSVAVRAATDLVDPEAARTYLAVPVPAAMFDTPFVLPYLHALGLYHEAMGHPQSALTHFRSAAELMARWGADAAEVASTTAGHAAEPARAERPAEAADGGKLTDAEQRVAALAAAGNTNRQIAGHLRITVSTVEQHLTKIYRKLNVHSRSGLRHHRR
ncbi:LuxR C-terminal-related transcriptional regulator [Catenuloplanes atrovinosus]|uniref:DNA-binding CsgD family transcriptional regulator n=1 Tax=Catenuloplanes atrovinosus TaxID=137266 RepID=A0AAE3YQS4_9ACTN|nr:LuxR C-terminal-related transcriptional regulator [Catenuloplanes atrovinosus]MDR7276955.1 DNA-binding CsgD family transcriptional regulator [Catenuloplanes atrovinosus]